MHFILTRFDSEIRIQIWIWICIEILCWIRIQIKAMRIQNTAYTAVCIYFTLLSSLIPLSSFLYQIFPFLLFFSFPPYFPQSTLAGGVLIFQYIGTQVHPVSILNTDFDPDPGHWRRIRIQNTNWKAAVFTSRMTRWLRVGGNETASPEISRSVRIRIHNTANRQKTVPVLLARVMWLYVPVLLSPEHQVPRGVNGDKMVPTDTALFSVFLQ